MSDTAIRDAIFKGLKKIAPEANPADLAADENLREALDIDSFDYLHFLIGLHDSLGVEIPESDYGRLRTLDDLVGYLSRRVAA
jgi:acyl carrier protein